MAYFAHPTHSSASAPDGLDVVGQRQAALLLPWPNDLLTLFSLRMAGHGMSISRIDMQCDPRYALKQLLDAREMGDATLALIAEQLFRCFEVHQSGLSAQTH
jgi:hypothetical protein